MGCVHSNARARRKEKEAISNEEQTRLEQLFLVLRHTKLADQASKDAITRCRTFTYMEIEAATLQRHIIFGGTGSGSTIFRGTLNEQEVAVKYLDIFDGQQSTRWFVNEVSALCRTQHSNIVRMIGFCCQGDQRILVYENLTLAESLEQRLFDLSPDKEPLDWITRKKILAGMANGLRYLHEQMNPPLQLGDLTSASILLAEGFVPKLSNFSLAENASPSGMHVDIYLFGMVCLEIITGRRADDLTRERAGQNLANWARMLVRSNMVDPLLRGYYFEFQMQLLLDFVSSCLEEQPTKRPRASAVATTMNVMEQLNFDNASNSSQP